MNEQEKSLKLAELAEWEEADATNIWTGEDLWNINSHYCPLEPYQNTRDGLAQFAAILLENIHLLPSFEQEHDQCGRWRPFEPTQSNLLDEILRKKGVEI